MKDYVKKNLGDLVKDTDLVKIYFIDFLSLIIKAPSPPFSVGAVLIFLIFDNKSGLFFINNGIVFFKLIIFN